jgi:hypothetical protein
MRKKMKTRPSALPVGENLPQNFVNFWTKNMSCFNTENVLLITTKFKLKSIFNC